MSEGTLVGNGVLVGKPLVYPSLAIRMLAAYSVLHRRSGQPIARQRLEYPFVVVVVVVGIVPNMNDKPLPKLLSNIKLDDRQDLSESEGARVDVVDSSESDGEYIEHEKGLVQCSEGQEAGLACALAVHDKDCPSGGFRGVIIL